MCATCGCNDDHGDDHDQAGVHDHGDVEGFVANARRINPQLRAFPVSAKTGAGLAPLADWLGSQIGVRA